MSLNYNINTREKAEEALRRARAGVEGVRENELLPCVILGENGDGYDVSTVDDQGNQGRIYERVFTHPDGAELEDGAGAWLWVPADGETPLILVSGGGGGGCMQGLTSIGVLFD